MIIDHPYHQRLLLTSGVTSSSKILSAKLTLGKILFRWTFDIGTCQVSNLLMLAHAQSIAMSYISVPIRAA